MNDRGTHDFSAAFDMFLLDCEARRLTPGTRQFYTAKLSLFIRWCDEQGIHTLQQLTAHDLRRYLVHLSRRKLSSQYQHNLARAIRTFLNFCVRDELLAVSPFAKVQMPRLEKKLLTALSPTEIHTVLRSCHTERDKALCLFLLDSGVRASELIALNLADVDMKSGLVTVHLGKGQKARTTYIGARTRKELRRYLATRPKAKPHAPLFLSELTGGRLTVDGLVQVMGRLQERSGVSTCTCHTFRRTFALNCLRNGMNIYVLARLMGHADITILRQYLPLVEDDLQEAHARFGAVDNLLG
ncbi:MAG: tyrosine-type recombinase/integrase [Caldilineaceae bacterium]|nr:tyrosine-type recombinase/integrase [Caldilineaceae bacterium]